MTDTQLYFAIGLPSALALVGILVNVGYFITLNARMAALETRMLALETRVAALESAAAVSKQALDIVFKKLDELETRRHG